MTHFNAVVFTLKATYLIFILFKAAIRSIKLDNLKAITELKCFNFPNIKKHVVVNNLTFFDIGPHIHSISSSHTYF